MIIYKMKKLLIPIVAVVVTFFGIFAPANCYGQSQKTVINKYLKELPRGKVVNDGKLHKYRMTAIYTNRDLYGNFTEKQKISGDYTRGFENGYVAWNNISISGSKNFSEPFPSGTRQEYMENFKYVPSPRMLETDSFKGFPAGTETVFAKNLVWDMMMIENFAWDFSDSLKLNRTYIIPEIKGEFAMADIGNYSHQSIQICWTGISVVNDKLCAVIEYRALDNKIELKMDQINTKGTEQYWGTTWVGLEDKQVEYAEVYGGTIQEIEVTGMKIKFLAKTIRELWVEKIQ
jgi:hypothetical protein